MAITLGQFLGMRAKNPDTPNDPYDPSRESFIELNTPQPFKPLGPGALPPAPPVVLSGPGDLPKAPNVALASPGQLPPPPLVTLAAPATLPPPPSVTLATPATLPPPPTVTLASPAILPPPPAVGLSIPAQLPPPPQVSLAIPAPIPPVPDPPLRSSPMVLPQPPTVTLAKPAELPAPPSFKLGKPGDLPVAPEFSPKQPGLLPLPLPVKIGDIMTHEAKQVLSSFSPDNGYAVFKDRYSPMGAGAAGEQAMDPVLHERQNERYAREPHKLIVHAMKQTAMYALEGKVWNPATISPPPIAQQFIKPTITLPTETLKKEAFTRANREYIDSCYANGIVPMRVKGENEFGFVKTRKGVDNENSDQQYLPLSFTDLRQIEGQYRTIYFRALNLVVNENIQPSWNKQSYVGRVDPVATYQSTERSFSLSFSLIAFIPQDIITIYRKLHWLSSMAYPSYDQYMQYKSGPVIKLRVGDLINAGVTGATDTIGKGLTGIIEGISFDYSETLWELKKNFKLPRNVNVSIEFTAIHERPLGVGTQGWFGGIRPYTMEEIEDGKAVEKLYDGSISNTFRNFGDGQELNYDAYANEALGIPVNNVPSNYQIVLPQAGNILTQNESDSMVVNNTQATEFGDENGRIFGLSSDPTKQVI